MDTRTSTIVEREFRFHLMDRDSRFKPEFHDKIVELALRAKFPVKLTNNRINPWRVPLNKIEAFLDEIARKSPGYLRRTRKEQDDDKTPLQKAEEKLARANSG